MAREITVNNFEISLVVILPNITTNHAIAYTYLLAWLPTGLYYNEERRTGTNPGTNGTKGNLNPTPVSIFVAYSPFFLFCSSPFPLPILSLVIPL